MKFPFYFSRKIANSKDNKNNLSRVIIFIGRLSVALGIIVSLITISTGLGSKKAIKQSLGDFGGEVSIKSTRSNASYNSSVLSREGLDLERIKALPSVADVQQFVTINGILRTENSFAGIVFKGVGEDFNAKRFSKFLVEGSIPHYDNHQLSMDVILSKEIADGLNKKLNDSIVAVFSKEDQKPLYRKFRIAGIYKTDIKMLDELYIIGSISNARKVQGIDKDEIGGLEVFLHDFDAVDTATNEIQNFIGYKNFLLPITEQFPVIVDWINIFNINVALIISIMLIVVIINIIMVLLILIIERTNSIGILKTMGANNVQIRMIFINYTLYIMIPGLLIGNLIGLGLLLVQKFTGVIELNPENYYVSQVPVELNPLYIFMISFGMLAISAVVLILPSYLISKISPIKAIKYH
ncbi:MAG: ABC transporter permease [Bergeyella cardium]